MARYIDADLLTAIMRNRYNEIFETYGYHDFYASGYDDAVDAVENAPTVDVVQREDYEAVIAGQETLQKHLVKIKADVAREIFANIENVLNREYTEIEQRRARIKDHDALDCIEGELCGLDYALQLVTECKEKYTDAIDTNDDHK